MDEAQYDEEVIEPATSRIIENVYAVLNGTTDQFENIHQAIEDRSEEHTSELQSHSFISYAVFCLKKKKKQTTE